MRLKTWLGEVWTGPKVTEPVRGEGFYWVVLHVLGSPRVKTIGWWDPDQELWHMPLQHPHRDWNVTVIRRVDVPKGVYRF